MTFLRSNGKRYSFDDNGATWSAERKKRLVQFSSTESFSEGFAIVDDLRATNTRMKFISCLRSNYRFLETRGKGVIECTSLDLSVPEGRDIRLGVLSANSEVSIAIFKDNVFVAGGQLERGKEFALGHGSATLRSESPANIYIISAPS